MDRNNSRMVHMNNSIVPNEKRDVDNDIMEAYESIISLLIKEKEKLHIDTSGLNNRDKLKLYKAVGGLDQAVIDLNEVLSEISNRA